jgi:hypothetical protein
MGDLMAADVGVDWYNEIEIAAEQRPYGEFPQKG